MGKTFAGVDLSHWNKINNIDELCANIDFVILKAGGNEYGKVYTDPFFESRYNAFTKRGIPVGAYFFVGRHFNTAQMGRDCAVEFAKILNHKTEREMLYGVWLDNESTNPKDKIGATDAAINFCNEMERRGYFCGIYGSEISVFQARYQVERLEKYAKWVARYSAKEPTMPKAIWQRTSQCIMPGVQGCVDFDVSYQDIAAAVKKMKKRRDVKDE